MTTVLGPDAGFEPPAPPARADAVALGRGLVVPWTAPAQLGVAVLAAAVYLVNLTVSGFANTYYSAAALAASQSWSAWFFGSIDASNFITVDKPPLSTMVMGLSVRLFGLSSSSILVPEALMGVATVVVLMAIVRRTMGSPAAVIAGLVAALTPAAVLIFRYNNPDALLTLLLVTSAYALIRGVERGGLRWVALAAVLVGLAFNTKYLQAWLVLPGYALVWALAAPGSFGHRIRGLLVAFAAVVIASGWWVAIMEILPAGGRPFVGGSTNGSALDLLLGYDGLGRIFGGSAGGPGGGPAGGAGFSGTPGILRLFNPELAGQIAWFVPLAFVGLAVGLWARRHAPRTDVRRAAYALWGTWLVVHVLVFSLMSGIIHSYYAVAMAPAIGALVGGGVFELWSLRSRRPSLPWAGLVLAGGLLVTGGTAALILGRTPEFAPGLAIGVAAITTAAAVLLIVPAARMPRSVALVAATVALGASLAGPAAYAVDTMGTAYGGGDPAAGPQVASADGRAAFPGGPGGPSGPAGGSIPGSNGAALGPPPAGAPAGAFPGGGVDAATSSALSDYLVANRGSARWIVAVSSANQAGSLELATLEPVMAMGGFSGSDPAPTLAQLQAYIASGELRFVIVGGRGGPGGVASDVTSWVQSSCSAVATVSATLYDCAGAVSGS